ncbi:MAG: DUF2500 domain-containing protein [Deltaproteobacteria bacterium]|nr:DUF2500 domain-containing protein [Deltaproteobacteria bacterium]
MPVVAFIVPVFMMLFGVVFFTFFMSGAPRDMQLFGGAFMVVWFGILGYALWRVIRVARAPLERVIAVVVNQRTSVSSHRHDQHRHTSTSYYVTLQREDGDRAEYTVGGGLAGLVSDADIGVAYVKQDLLLDFRRFDA